MLAWIGRGLEGWVAGLARVALDLGDRLAPPPVFDLVPEAGQWRLRRAGGGEEVVARLAMASDGRWRIAPQDAGRLIAGAHLRLLVPQGWAIRRALEPLPAKSLPFIDAFVRHQIDRVTPWRAADCHVAVSTAATPQAADRVTVSILALPRRVIDPLVAPLLAGRPRSLRIIPGASTEETGIDVPAGGDLRRLVTQRLAASLLVVVAALPVALWAAGAWQAARLGSAAEALDAAIASRKQRLAAAAALQGRALDGEAFATGEAARGVLVVQMLDKLSELLPDHTYLTDFRLDGTELQIGGVSREVNSLVPLLERSGLFVDVAFQAPTTRLLDRPGDRFSIQMRIGRSGTTEPRR